MAAFIDEKDEQDYIYIRSVYESLESMNQASVKLIVIEEEVDALFLDLILAEGANVKSR